MIKTTSKWERWRRLDILLIAAAFLLVAPFLSIQRTTDFMIFCIFVLAYDLLYGYMGRLSFGHMLYLGTGAYGAAMCATYWSDNPLLALAAGALAGMAVGLLLGPIVMRTTGACFALINLSFNQMGFFLALIAFSGWTGGEDGKSAFFAPLWGIDVNDRAVVFTLVLVSLLGTVLLMRRLTDSPFGLLLRTIKENEQRSVFLGYNVFAYKWIAFVISTTVAAFAGALSMINYSYVTPSFIDPGRSVEVVFASLIGGAGSVYGALLGGVGFMAISNFLPNYIQRWELFLGLVLLALVFKFREGLWGYAVRLAAARNKEENQ
ncbi:MAG: branched-chain amino acid ABC transporter permease [Magnetospirillum sp.]|nr:branched-chain amino acid ABC transporter permease [Magnetospirillum sp.]